MNDPVKVIVVDDQQLLRRGLTMLLGTLDGVEVVGQAGDGREALNLIAAIESDVVLVASSERRLIDRDVSYEESDHLRLKTPGNHRRLYPRPDESGQDRW